MNISTEISSIAGIVGEEKGIEYIAKAGFDAWDFSMGGICRYDWYRNIFLENSHPLAGDNYLAFARRLKRVGEDNGIICNQSHAPFPSGCPQIRSYFKRAIECTAEAGGKICVIHPDNDKGPEENAQMYFELLPFAKECGVKIATENMFNWDVENGRALFAACASSESFCAHLNAVNDEYFVACLDIGHAEMMGPKTTAVELIKSLGFKLECLHIHDNNKISDMHQVPFSQKIDFVEIVKVLKESGYNGYFTLEAESFLKAYTKENVFEGVQKLADAAKKLAHMYESF